MSREKNPALVALRERALEKQRQKMELMQPMAQPEQSQPKQDDTEQRRKDQYQSLRPTVVGDTTRQSVRRKSSLGG